jgi:hypothetical protein
MAWSSTFLAAGETGAEADEPELDPPLVSTADRIPATSATTTTETATVKMTLLRPFLVSACSPSTDGGEVVEEPP